MDFYQAIPAHNGKKLFRDPITLVAETLSPVARQEPSQERDERGREGGPWTTPPPHLFPKPRLEDSQKDQCQVELLMGGSRVGLECIKKPRLQRSEDYKQYVGP